MEKLAAIEAFVRSAELRSFSAAARQLALTPAAVSKSVAKLEDSLGVRLFQRTTRQLTLTEAGEALYRDAAPGLGALQNALARAAGGSEEPTGTFKLSLAPAFGRDYVLPMLPAYLKACPRVVPDLRFENRQVDLIGEGYDAAIGVGYELSAGLVARELARIDVIAVASKGYVARHGAPSHPDELAAHDVIAFRTSRTNKLRVWAMKTRSGKQATADPVPRVVMNELDPMLSALRAGLGVALMPTSQVLPDLERGALVRVMPSWYAEGGPVMIYFSSQRLLPARTRIFIDLLTAHFKQQKLAQRFRAGS